jgi:hypothetical protein
LAVVVASKEGEFGSVIRAAMGNKACASVGFDDIEDVPSAEQPVGLVGDESKLITLASRVAEPVRRPHAPMEDPNKAAIMVDSERFRRSHRLRFPRAAEAHWDPTAKLEFRRRRGLAVFDSVLGCFEVHDDVIEDDNVFVRIATECAR